MEGERPSKVHISATSIQEVSLTKEETKLTRKNSDAKRKKSITKLSNTNSPTSQSLLATNGGENGIKANPASTSASRTHGKTEKNQSGQSFDQPRTRKSLEGVSKPQSKHDTNAKKSASLTASNRVKTNRHVKSGGNSPQRKLDEKKASIASLPTTVESSPPQQRQRSSSVISVGASERKRKSERKLAANTNERQGQSSKGTVFKPSNASVKTEKSSLGSKPTSGNTQKTNAALPPDVSTDVPISPQLQSRSSLFAAIKEAISTSTIPVEALETDAACHRVSSASTFSRSSRQRRHLQTTVMDGALGQEGRHLLLSVAETDHRKRSFLSSSFEVDGQTLERMRLSSTTVCLSKTSTSAQLTSPDKHTTDTQDAKPQQIGKYGVQVKHSESNSRRNSAGKRRTSGGASRSSSTAQGGGKEPKPLPSGQITDMTSGSKEDSVSKDHSAGSKRTGVENTKDKPYVEKSTHTNLETDIEDKGGPLSQSDKGKCTNIGDNAKMEANRNSARNYDKSQPKAPNTAGKKSHVATGGRTLATTTARAISRLTGSSNDEPAIFNLPGQAPLVATPSDIIEDRDAGVSLGSEIKKIPEEWFASKDAYRESIDDTMQKLLAESLPAACRERPAHSHDEATEARPPDESVSAADREVQPVAGSQWSSSTDEHVGSDGHHHRRRRSARRRSDRKRSSPQHREWKRKTSARVYRDYLRQSDPVQNSDDNISGKSMKSAKSTTVSAYPASSSEVVSVDEKNTWSDISSEMSEASKEPGQSASQVPKESATVSTSTTEVLRTEGTQTTSNEVLLLDRRSCLVKVLAALQRLNTDEALQVARILCRSLMESRPCRANEDADTEQLIQPPAVRTQSEKMIPTCWPSPAGLGDDIPDEDLNNMTKIVSQIDLMVRSKLHIAVAPYSLIYETLIKYHLEIVHDSTPSVAIFNYYLTQQGHPLFEDTSGFSRPTILQVGRESLELRLYAHQPSAEPRQLPDKARLLDLQLLFGELLICPFCGLDVIWGQREMCAEFCCDQFASLVVSEYEEDLGRIRRQAQLRALGERDEVDEPDALLAAAVSSGSGVQAPAKLSCDVDQNARLRSIQRYGQDGHGAPGSPQLAPFTLATAPRGSAGVGKAAAAVERAARADRRKERRHSSQQHARRRSGSPAVKRRRARRDRSSAADADDDDTKAAGSGKRPRRKPKHASTADTKEEVERMEALLGRRLSPDEIQEIIDQVSRGSPARRLSVTTTGVRAREGIGSMADVADERSPEDSKVDIDKDPTGDLLDNLSMLTGTAGAESLDADDEGGGAASASTTSLQGRGAGSSRRSRRKTRGTGKGDGSGTLLDGDEHSGSQLGISRRGGDRQSHADHSDREVSEHIDDDQMHYRLSDSVFLAAGVTLTPLDENGEQRQIQLGTDEPPPPQPRTRPADRGSRQFLQEHYPGGSVFVTWFNDGSGHVLYPSGHPAVLITQESAGRRFVVMPDRTCPPASNGNCVLAIFDPRGIGFVYSEKGSIRLLFDQWEGWYHRDDGGTRRWQWMDLDNHVNHSPVLQPIIFAISKHVAVRVIRQDYIMLSFWACQRSARFNVGVTAKLTPADGTLGHYRLLAHADDRERLAQLRSRVRQILTDMARMTDEPARYVTQNITGRDLSYHLRGPRPSWVTAEPRRPYLPDGVSAALMRRASFATSFVGVDALQASLLQRMAPAQQSAVDWPAIDATSKQAPSSVTATQVA